MPLPMATPLGECVMVSAVAYDLTVMSKIDILIVSPVGKLRGLEEKQRLPPQRKETRFSDLSLVNQTSE
jgi:hypothetical protein